jgi:hypothetical protein
MSWGAIFDVVKAAAPAAISAGAALVGQSRASSAQQQAAEQSAQASQEAADILGAGYDTQLEQLLAGSATLSDLLGRGFDATTGWQASTADQYADDLGRGVDAYGTAVGQGANRYRDELAQTDARFRNDLYGGVDHFAGIYDAGLDQADALLGEGADAFGARYAPYEAGGQQALSALSRIVAQDPNDLTLTQRRTVDDFLRSSDARLAASGLRGAGRAGVAAMNEGEAALRAQLIDQNQRRSDAATQQLASMGYGATGAVAGNDMAVASTQARNAAQRGAAIGGALLDADRLAASNSARTGELAARTTLDTTRDTATKGLAANEAAARFRGGINADIGNEIGQYYDRLGSVAANEAGLRAANTMGKATAQAGAKTAGGQALMQAGMNAGQGWGQTLGWLGGVIAQSAKDSLTKPSKP